MASAVEALWDADEARRFWRAANFAGRQLNGMRALLSEALAISRGVPWKGPSYASEILDRSHEAQLSFVCDVEMLVAAIDNWADKPLGRTRRHGVRYRWPG